MQNSIELKRTGDFWIDMGLLGLWRSLIAGSEDNPVKGKDGFRAKILVHDDLYDDEGKVGLNLRISSNSLIIEYADDKILNDELSKAIETIKPNYFGKAKTGKKWWQRLGLFFFKNQSPSVFFKLPTAIMKEQRTKWSKGVCDFCGMEERDVKQVGAGEHPMVVVPSKFSSFYSNLRGEVKICNWCAFASKFTPIRLFYTVSGKSITAIGMESDNLIDLLNASNSFSKLFAQSEWYRNFPYVMRYTNYPLEVFLDFLFSIIQEIENKRDVSSKNMLQSGIISKVHIIQATSGQGLSIDRYYVIPNLPKVFDFIFACYWLDRNQKKHNSLFYTVNALVSKQGKDIETIKREEFARRLFYNKDISDILEEFLIGNIQNKKTPLDYFVSRNIDRLIRIYMLNQMDMDSNQLNVTKKIGDMVGALAAQTDNKSLLYNLRSIGNRDNLLAFLNQLLIRYIEDIKPERRILEILLAEVDNTNWHLYKSLIGIYSALRYVEEKSAEEKQNLVSAQ